MKKQQGKNLIAFPLSMLVFGVFALCLIAALLAGAGAYRRLTERDSAAYDTRICSGYLTTKLRTAYAGEITLINAGAPEGGALRIAEEIDGEEYASYIYCLDGWLRELYTQGAVEPEYSCGEKLLEIKSLEMRLEKGLFTAEIEAADGEAREIWVYTGSNAEERK